MTLAVLVHLVCPLRMRGLGAMQHGECSRSSRERREVLEPIAGLHKLGSQVADGSEATARGEQLRAQTGAVSTRKHFYRTEVFQIQDVLLEKARVNWTTVLGAATAFLQATAAQETMRPCSPRRIARALLDRGAHLQGTGASSGKALASLRSACR